MNEQDRHFLLKALCGYFPYGLKVSEYFEESKTWTTPRDFEGVGPYYILMYPEKIKPYLRPMTNITDEERAELVAFTREPQKEEWTFSHRAYDYLDWLNKHHFDYRHLIEMGLALPAPKEMYDTKDNKHENKYYF